MQQSDFSQKKQNILFITHYPAMYGANQSLFTLLVELRKNYPVNPVVLMRSYGPLCELLEKHAIRYYILHFYWWVYEKDTFFERILNIRKQFRNLLRLKHISKVLSVEKIDLVYTNSVPVNIGFFLSKIFHCPHIWHIRESLEQFPFKLSIGTFLSKKLFLRGADRYILISDFLVNEYKKFLPSSRVVKIYNGISPDSEIRIMNKVSGFINICLAGIICEQKNQLDAIKALKILTVDKGYRNIRLHLIGGKGNMPEYSNSILKYINDWDLEINIVFHGHQSQVNQIFRKMNLGLMCSHDEAFGRVTIEYMLNRLPVIASRSGANPELVKEGINGEIYELNNFRELAEKIEKYIIHPELLDLVGSQAYDYAIQNFSTEKYVDSAYRVIEELLSNDTEIHPATADKTTF
jgi:glycosyltransferase involved in cell wall biosynthesis